MSYIGNEPIVSATRTVTEITATAGQTVFTANGGYTVGYLDVFVNGSQLQAADFTATNGSTVTLTEAAQANDQVRLVAWGTFQSANAVQKTGDTMSGNLSVPSLQVASNFVSPHTGFKNRIINGAMMIDQRNAGASGTGADQYTIDRWSVYMFPSSRGTWQQNNGSVTPPAGFRNYLGFNTTSAYSVTGSDEFIFAQSIEGFNTADLMFGTANASTFTLSFWVRSSLTGTFGGSFRNQGAARSYPFTYTISSANTWEYKTITVAGDTTGSWNTGNGVGLSVIFSMGAGTSKSATAGSWQSGNFVSATGATSVVGTNGATFYITGVQLERGTTATSFDYRPYGTELALCQRYYQESRTASGYGNTSSSIQASVSLVVSMRAIPSVSKTSGTFQFTDGAANYTSSSAPSSYFGNSSGGSLNQGGYSGLTLYRPLVMDGQASFAGFTFSAEL